jgi:hypothetical protein
MENEKKSEKESFFNFGAIWKGEHDQKNNPIICLPAGKLE